MCPLCFPTETTTSCTCQREIRSLVSHVSAAVSERIAHALHKAPLLVVLSQIRRTNPRPRPSHMGHTLTGSPLILAGGSLQPPGIVHVTKRVAWCTWVVFFAQCLRSVCRSTLVSKEPESMLAHMFRDKSKSWLQRKFLGERVAVCLLLNGFRWICFRCVGEQAGPARGLPHRPQPWILWAYSQLLETRTAHYQRRHKYTGWAMLWILNNGFVSLCQNLTMISPPGVLEEARFFGIELLADQLEAGIKVNISVARDLQHCTRLLWTSGTFLVYI